ncbi:MAG: ribonuclease P protein component [Gammaproteobacteria bacterium]|jgi:ribonuclease P protein component|nr:ribonuclease P protein component [Gammaproteobacteria bacterium]HJL96375.1 ribonuclease P protein component [SAR86 cluster bacterium]HJM59369.1 ribonuclease P protein component [SAR86 cluster bacterium]|tara:strand:+ start:7460 stop:7789 length:330 start_codon:yes stop_codon:yes gene_type:complete
MGLKHSIPSSEGFSKIFSSPDFKHSSSRLLILSKENALKHSRLGVAIRKKDIKLAVNRNKIKRKIKGSFRSKVLELPKRDYVVLVKKGFSEKDVKFKKDLECLWDKFIK